MKKNLLILAVAGLALASCSNDETVAVNQSLADANVINFRALVSNMTRATDVTASTLQTSGFNVFATVYNSESEGAQYFNNTAEVAYNWDVNSQSYTSQNKYYWPSEGSLNFYAWAASVPAQVTHTALTKAFTVTPLAMDGTTTASGQTDLVFANTNNKSKAGTYGEGGAKKYGADGVPLNFRHTESKVIIKVKNTNPNLKFTVGKVAIGNLYGTGTYTYPGGNTGINTDGENTAVLTGGWAQSGSQNVVYTQSAMSSSESYNVFSVTQAAKTVPNTTATDCEMILIPQTFLYKDVYNGTTAHVYGETETPGSTFEGSYISAELKIQNPQNDAYIIGGESKFVTAIWPLPQMAIDPGYKYTFTVDLAGGGYYFDNQDDNADLDPILDGAEIRFVSVTVDAWNETLPETVLGNVIKGKSYTFNETAAAAGTYSITISGLTSGSTLALGATSSENLSGLKIMGLNGSSEYAEISTTPASGVVTITGTLAANSTSGIKTSTITLNETGTATSTTTISIVQAASE